MKLQLKRSNVIASGAAKIPTSAQLEYGELAINYNQQDPAIFLKDSNNNVIRIGGIGNIADDGQVELPTTTNPPTSPTPANGNLWYNSEDGRLYVYYVDGNSSQWVDASPDTWQSTVIPDITNTSYQAGSLDDRYNNKSGNATFVDRVDVGGLTVDSNLTPASGTSVEHFYSSTGGVIQAFDRDNGNLEPLRVRGSTWDLGLDGSATFGGNVNLVGSSSYLLVSRTGATGTTTIAQFGTDTIAQAIEFKANGSASFANGGFAIDGDGEITTNIKSAGHIELDSSGSFSSPKIKLFANSGNATFAGKATAEDFDSNHPSDGRFGRFNWAGIRFTDTSGNNVFRVDADGGGSATIAGDIIVGNGGFASQDKTGLYLAATAGFCNVYHSASTSGNFLSFTKYDGSASGNFTTQAQITDSGAATFAADASINSLTVGRGPGNATGNTVVGEIALASSSGGYNTAVGHQAMRSNTSGEDHVGVGWLSLYANTTGQSNVAVGRTAMYSNTSGASNVAIGRDALRLNTVGFKNVAIGREASYSNTNGAQNTACGYQALYNNTTANSNSAFGYKTLANNSTGSQNTAVGQEALRDNTTGGNNVGVGLHASFGNTTGLNNVSVGVNSAKNNQSGGENTAVGYKASESNVSGNYNTSLGATALKASSSSYNTSVGWRSLYSQTSGAINTAFGAEALYSITSGSYNSALGYGALRQSTGGERNVAVGYQSLYSNTHGAYHTSVGMYAAYYNTTGTSNSSFGYTALHNNTTGGYSTAIGYQSLYNQSTASYNVALGMNAGYTLTTGQGNTLIGYNVNTTAANTDNSIVIGKDISGINGAGYITIGMNTTSDKIYNNFQANATWFRNSDVRLKKDIITNTNCGLGFINDLRTVTYKWRAPAELDQTMSGYNPNNTEASYKATMYGFIAQEVKQALEDNGITDFGGWTSDNTADDLQGISYEMFVMPLVTAVQELTTMVKELQAQIETLKG